MTTIDESDRVSDNSDQEMLLGQPSSLLDPEFEDPQIGTLSTSVEELPQGRNYGVYASTVYLLSRIIGSGIFSTPGGVYRDCGGSTTLFFGAWILAAIISFLNMVVYLELGTLFPRSGGFKFFLENMYQKPKYLASTMISIQVVLFGFTCSNAMIFGQYLMTCLGFEVDIDKSNVTRYIGVLLIAVCGIVQTMSVKTSVGVQNVMGGVKIGLLALMVITGIYAIFVTKNAAEGTGDSNSGVVYTERAATISSFTSATLQAIFSFNGWESIYFITSEIKKPVRTLKIVGPLSLVITFVVYTIINIAYVKVLSRDEILKSGQLIGSLLFEKVYGKAIGKQFLSINVALSAAGNVYVVLYGISRMSQEVFREGILPFSQTMAQNLKNLKTPVRTIALSIALSTVVLLVPPPGDVFSYIVSLEVYMMEIVSSCVLIGFFKLRKEHPDVPRPIRVHWIAPIVALVFMFYLLVTPLWQNTTTMKHMMNYSHLAWLLVAVYFGYWALKFQALPRLGGYTYKVERVVLKDGLVVRRFRRVYGSE